MGCCRDIIFGPTPPTDFDIEKIQRKVDGIIENLRTAEEETKRSSLQFGQRILEFYGQTVHAEALSKALEFFCALPPDVPMPEICVLPSGEFSFDWYSDDGLRCFSVSVGPDGLLTFAGIFGEDHKLRGREIFSGGVSGVIRACVELVNKND